MRGYPFATPICLGLALILGAACSDDGSSSGGIDKDAARSAAARARGGDAVDGGVQLPPPGPRVVMCGSEPCQCNNGVDDDGDGVGDGFDAECTGALDDDESSFATGIPGDNRDPKWQDCFFDGNSGAGDDRCRYPTECLTGELPQTDEACATTEDCRNNCQPLVPNGCDCFGCCAVQLPSGQSLNVTLGASCSLETIGDPDACAPCTPSDSCGNECGECELCPGKTAADLPASCNPPPPPPPPEEEPIDPPPPPPAPEPVCEGGTACAEQADCLVDEFCSLGCCLTVIR
jgi:hypothetical protein